MSNPVRPNRRIGMNVTISVNYLAVISSAVAAFVFAGVYYTAFADRLAAQGSAPGSMSGSMIAVELGRTLIFSVIVAALVSLLRITDPIGAVQLAVALWIAFPVVLLAGSVIHENVPWALAAIHAGDWLAKLLIVTVTTSLWR